MQANALRKVAEPVLGVHGLELEALTVQKAGSRDIVRLTVDGDGPSGRGPDLDDIARASRAVSQALDEADVAGERPYVLEVGSRGVDAPLTRPAHWRRNTGRLVTVALADGGSVTGRIEASTEIGATLREGARLLELAYKSIASAVVNVELNRPADGEVTPDSLSKES